MLPFLVSCDQDELYQISLLKFSEIYTHLGLVILSLFHDCYHGNRCFKIQSGTFYLGIKFHIKMNKGQVKLVRRQMACRISQQCT